MAAIADIAIQDGQATPATHTYKAIESGPKSGWRTANSSLPLVGQETITASISKTTTGLNVVRLVVDLPALETASGSNSSGYTAAPKVAYSNRIKVEAVLPERGTASQRTDLRVLLRNLLTNAQVVDIIDNLTPPF